jgi:3-methyl-2-oxobutanoate hydroxymethyltransferase
MLDIPTIGIGAGPLCRGQVLVTYDVLGMSAGKLPRFVPKNQEFCSAQECLKRFVAEVRIGRFPSADHCYGLNSANADLLSGSGRLGPQLEAVRP